MKDKLLCLQLEKIKLFGQEFNERDYHKLQFLTEIVIKVFGKGVLRTYVEGDQIFGFSKSNNNALFIIRKFVTMLQVSQK